MKKATKIALCCGAGAAGCVALALYLKKRKQNGGAVACGVVGGCAAAVAVGSAVHSVRSRRVPGWRRKSTWERCRGGGRQR